MIKLIEKVIRDNHIGSESAAGKRFSFLKYSTPASGRTPNDKVIFFVFKGGERRPFLCVKTVRTYGAREVVKRNFHNLDRLNTITRDTKYEKLFAEVLYLHDDGENIFSIETVCPGRKARLHDRELERIIKSYISFQNFLSQKNMDNIPSISKYAEEIVMRSSLEIESQREIIGYLNTLPLEDISLPRLIQHGDVTPDNVLVSRKGICIVDCDYIGLVDIPGFDIFGLIYRYDRTRVKELCEKYLPAYYKSIGGVVEDYRGLLFVYYFIERTVRKQNQSTLTSKEIIDGFKEII